MQSHSAGCLACRVYGLTSTQQAAQRENGACGPVGLSRCGRMFVVDAIYVKTLLLRGDITAVLRDAVKKSVRSSADAADR